MFYIFQLHAANSHSLVSPRNHSLIKDALYCSGSNNNVAALAITAIPVNADDECGSADGGNRGAKGSLGLQSRIPSVQNLQAHISILCTHFN